MNTATKAPEVIRSAHVPERCDRCGAAAKAVVRLLSGGELAFCGHHANKHGSDLVATARSVTLDQGFTWQAL